MYTVVYADRWKLFPDKGWTSVKVMTDCAFPAVESEVPRATPPVVGTSCVRHRVRLSQSVTNENFDVSHDKGLFVVRNHCMTCECA